MELQAICLLLIEDNPGDVLLLEEALNKAPGYEFHVIHAGSLAEGLHAAVGQPVDAVLLDLSLPDCHGLTTIQKANEILGHLPIIVLTGSSNQETGIEAVRIGAQDYLVKGNLNPDLLVRSIRYAMERKVAHQALQKAHDEMELKVRARTAELMQLNEVLQTVTNCNQALVRAADEPTLLREICEAIIKVGNYRMAWVGFPGNDPDRIVYPAASVGFDDGYLERANVTWADNERGRGPTGAAIRTGKIRVGRDFLTDPELGPWREAALERGFRSSIALPLVAAGQTLGALTIYASQPEAFDDKQIQLLGQLADDLAFGISALRTQLDLRRVEREVLEATERERQRIARDLHDSILGGLAGVGMMLGGLKQALSKSAPDRHQLLANTEWVSKAVSEILTQSRGLVRGLSPMGLKSDGLCHALKELASTTTDLFSVDCRFQAESPVLIEDETVSTQLYRICQEAVNNAVKHSGGSSIVITLKVTSEGLLLEVVDDGKGLPENAGHRGGMGLGTMTYRAKMIGAQLIARRGEKIGTAVRCLVDKRAANFSVASPSRT